MWGEESKTSAGDASHWGVGVGVGGGVGGSGDMLPPEFSECRNTEMPFPEAISSSYLIHVIIFLKVIIPLRT